MALFCDFAWFLGFILLNRLRNLRFFIVKIFPRYTFSWTFHTSFLNFIFLLVPAFSLSFLTRRTQSSTFLVFVGNIKSSRCLAYVRIRAENNIGNQNGARFTILRNGENWLLRVTLFSVYFVAAFITGSRRTFSAAAAGSLSTVSGAVLPLFFVVVAILASFLALGFTSILSFYRIFADCTRSIGFLAIFMSFIWFPWHWEVEVDCFGSCSDGRAVRELLSNKIRSLPFSSDPESSETDPITLFRNCRRHGPRQIIEWPDSASLFLFPSLSFSLSRFAPILLHLDLLFFLSCACTVYSVHSDSLITAWFRNLASAKSCSIHCT